MWNFDKYAKNVAIITEDAEDITYEFLAQNIEDFKQALPSRSMLVNLCSNSIGSVFGYIACIEHSVVSLMLNESLNTELLYGFIDSYKPEYIWVSKDRTQEFAGEVVYSAFGYVLIKKEYTKHYPLHDDLALLLTTSGSTGSPKLVRLSHKNLLANTRSIVEYLQLDSAERAITTLPLNYTYGLSILNTHLFAGASIILTPYSLMQREFWDMFSKLKATSLAGVPYTYEMLNRLNLWKQDLPYLRTMTQAGGKLSADLHKKFAENSIDSGRKFFVMYGQTEATSRMSYLPPENSLDKCGSIGIAIPQGEFSLIDANGDEILATETTGELVYKGDNVMLGYASCGEDLTKGDEQQGILFTGDMAKRDEDGYYYIVGRKKRFLKIFGNRVNLDEIEQLIKIEFKNVHCACAGQDDLMKIFITDEELLKPVQTFVSHKTGLNFKAFKVIYIESIPKNDSNKTLYSQLEEV